MTILLHPSTPPPPPTPNPIPWGGKNPKTSRCSRKLKFGMKDNEKPNYCTQLQTKINPLGEGKGVPNTKCLINHQPQNLGNF